MQLTDLHAVLAGLVLTLVGCSEHIPLPWGDRGGETPAPLRDIDCDDLPALTAEEEARAPFEVSLEKGVPVLPVQPPRYSMLPGVTLSPSVAAKVEKMDEVYFGKTRKRLVITSGTRDAARQAKAMYKLMKLGGDIIQLYKNKAAAAEIKQAYDRAEIAGKNPDQVVSQMHRVISAQIQRGIYISAHLRAGAVDVRNRTMSDSEKRAFVESMAELGNIRVLEELSPPHFHVQID